MTLGRAPAERPTIGIPRPRLRLEAHPDALAALRGAAAELPASPFAGLMAAYANLALGGVELTQAAHLMAGGFELYADGRLILAGTVLIT